MSFCESRPPPCTALVDRQHYRLASWRVADNELNWRRFFTINDFAGLAITSPFRWKSAASMTSSIAAWERCEGCPRGALTARLNPVAS